MGAKSESNIGITGIDSIRLGGMPIDQLPLAEGARVGQQMPAAQESARQTKIANVKARYPKQTVAYLLGSIKECQVNIERIKKFRDDQRAKIEDYRSQMSMCDYRDQEIAKLDPEDSDDKEKIRELKFRFPPYNVVAMQQQIVQFEEGCQRCDDVIDQDHKSIAELSETLGRARQRDTELRNLGE